MHFYTPLLSSYVEDKKNEQIHLLIKFNFYDAVLIIKMKRIGLQIECTSLNLFQNLARRDSRPNHIISPTLDLFVVFQIILVFLTITVALIFT